MEYSGREIVKLDEDEGRMARVATEGRDALPERRWNQRKGFCRLVLAGSGPKMGMSSCGDVMRAGIDERQSCIQNPDVHFKRAPTIPVLSARFALSLPSAGDRDASHRHTRQRPHPSDGERIQLLCPEQELTSTDHTTSPDRVHVQGSINACQPAARRMIPGRR